MANLSSDDAERYEVDHILDVRKRGNTTQYLVKWKGYESDEETWESEKNLKHSVDAIDEFKKKKGNLVKTPSRKKSTRQQTEETVTKKADQGSKSVTRTTTVTKVTRTVSGAQSESSSPESSPLMGRRMLQTRQVVTKSSTTKAGSTQSQKKACSWSMCPATCLTKCCNVFKMDCPTTIVLMCFLFIILTFMVQLPK